MTLLLPKRTVSVIATLSFTIFTTNSWQNVPTVTAFSPQKQVKPVALNAKGKEIIVGRLAAVSIRAEEKSNEIIQNKRATKRRKNLVRSKQRAKSVAKTTKKQNNNKRTFKPLKDLELGSHVSGKIVDVCDFGAFINIGYATRGSRGGTALLHISQIQDERIEDINSVIKVGDFIKDARVISIDLAKGEVGVSLRKQRPKRRTISTFKVGDELNGKVHSVVPYGAFIDVGATSNPLLHISRITGGTIENVRHYLNEGDPVTVHVIDVDEEKNKMAVSMLDKKADIYLDRRMSQRMKRYYGTTAKGNVDDDKTELDYFDQAIRELEEALKDRR